MQFSEIRKPGDLDVDRGSGPGHTAVHIWSRSTTHTPNYIEIGKKLFVDVWTDGRTHMSSVNLLAHRLEVT